jgi:hypothetical protein
MNSSSNGKYADLILIVVVSFFFLFLYAVLDNPLISLLPAVLFFFLFPGYVLVAFLFPKRGDMTNFDRLILSIGLSIVSVSLIGLILNYTPITLSVYSVNISIFVYLVFMCGLIAMVRNIIPSKDLFYAGLEFDSFNECSRKDLKEFFTGNTKSKILISVCLLSLLVSVFLAFSFPATGYEPSIYASTPVAVWLSIIFSFLCGILVIYTQVYTKSNQKWLLLLGFALMYLSYGLVLSMGILRGYFMWCMNGDPATHLGIVKEILTTGYSSSLVIYPVAHIYMVEAYYILRADLVALHKLVPLFFGLMYPLYLYLFAKSVFYKREQVIFTLAAGLTLVNGWYLNFTPNHLSNLFFPLVLFVLLKAFTVKKMQWAILTVLFVFLYPPFHPVPTITFLAILLSLWLPGKIYSFIKKEPEVEINLPKVTLLILLVVWTITWISSFYVWESTVRNLYALIEEGRESHLNALIDEASMASSFGYSVFDQIVKVMGGLILFSIIALICFPLLMRAPDKKKASGNLLSLYGPIVTLSFFSVFFYLLNIGFGPLRLSIYLVILFTPFVGFFIDRLLQSTGNGERKIPPVISCLFVLFILGGAFVSGLLNVYPSTYLLTSSWQTTATELNGVQWLFANGDMNVSLVGITMPVSRFANLLLTSEERKTGGVTRNIHESQKLPYHFGYNSSSSIANVYPSKAYILIGSKDKSLYVDVLPEMAPYRFNSDDFQKLETDIYVNKYYTTGDFEILCATGNSSKKI